VECKSPTNGITGVTCWPPLNSEYLRITFTTMLMRTPAQHTHLQQHDTAPRSSRPRRSLVSRIVCRGDIVPLLAAVVAVVTTAQQLWQARWQRPFLVDSESRILLESLIVDNSNNPGRRYLSSTSDYTGSNPTDDEEGAASPTSMTSPTSESASAQQPTATRTVVTTRVLDTLNDQARHVISWQGLPAMDAFVDSIWHGNLFCSTVQNARKLASVANNDSNDSLLPIKLNISFECRDLFQNSPSGSGNFILALYMMRSSAAELGNINVHFYCHDALATRQSLILPWFTGSWYATTTTTAASTLDRSDDSEALERAAQRLKHACCPFWCVSLGHMHGEMQYDLRRMAIALVGVRPNHASTDYAQQHVWGQRYHTAPNTSHTQTIFVPQLPLPKYGDAPVFPSVELDDAVIHFRCGDLLSTNITSYGFMTFAGYTRHISPQARSIGILTQPFGDSIRDSPFSTGQQRLLDSSNAVKNQRCRTLVLALADYVAQRHRHAKVFIRNDAHETVALTYARMVMANQTIGAMSTFSVFPILATFGTGYFMKPKRGSPNSWLSHFKGHGTSSNLVLFAEKNVMVGSQTRELWDSSGEAAVLDWFRS
jgi:hypothetical protein